jgi:hypothetical protein
MDPPAHSLVPALTMQPFGRPTFCHQTVFPSKGSTRLGLHNWAETEPAYKINALIIKQTIDKVYRNKSAFKVDICSTRRNLIFIPSFPFYDVHQINT